MKNTPPFLIALAALLNLAGCGGNSDSNQSGTSRIHYIRLDTNGAVYAGSGDYGKDPWACVHDQNTGLVWEVKTRDGGLHSRDATFTWYDPVTRSNGGDAGLEGGGNCAVEKCDTQNFPRAVNAVGLCGFHDWRTPKKLELGSISEPGIKYPGPTIERPYFPNTQSGEYWSTSPYRLYPQGAWAWNFAYSLDRVDWKSVPKHVRLVRGKPSVTLKGER